jgi:hypothetical protein
MANIQTATSLFSAYKSMSAKPNQQGQSDQPGEQSQTGQSAPRESSFSQAWDDSTRRQELIVRGPPPKGAVSMAKYFIIAVVIIAILLIYYGLGRKWEQPPKYESVFNSFTPDRVVLHPERRPAREMVSDATRMFGIMPRQSINLHV